MKRLLPALLLVLSGFYLKAQDTISVKEALDRGLVELEIEGHHGYGSKFKSTKPSSSHYGECIALGAKGKGDSTLVLRMPVGSVLIPGDSSYQNMIITRTAYIDLNREDDMERFLKLFAMCGEIQDKSPHRGIFFEYGGLADSLTVEMAKTIEAEDQQDRFGQVALWSVTDHDKVNRIAKLMRDSSINRVATALMQKTGLVVDTSSGEITQYVREEAKPVIEEPKEPIKEDNGWLREALLLIGGVLIGVIASNFVRRRNRNRYE